MEDGEESRAYMARVRQLREEFEKKQAAPPEVKPAAVAPKVEEPKPAEVKPPETKAPEDDLDKDPAAGVLSTDDLAPIPPRELYQKISADPELAAKLEAQGVNVEDLMKGQRLASQYIKVLEQFPGGMDDIVYAKEQATTFGKLDDIFTSVQSGGMKAVDKLIGALTELDYVIGDDGNPLVDDKGTPLQQGNTGAFLAHLGDYTFNLRMDKLEEVAKDALKANPDDDDAHDLLSAVERIKARLSGSAPDDKLTPAQKAEAERLKAERTELDQTRQADAEAKVQQFEDTITTSSDNTFDSEVLEVLKKTDLRPEQYNLILGEVRDTVAAKLVNDTMFTSKRDWIMRAKPSPEVEKRRIAHNVNNMRTAANGKNGVLAQVLGKYGVKVIQQQKERRDTINAQVQASRAEPKVSTSTAAPKPAMNNDQLSELARENLSKRGEDPTDSRLLLREMRTIQGTAR